MKIDFNQLNKLLEEKATKAIQQLATLKCSTNEFREVLDAIVYMMEVSKDLKQYDIECPDCKHQTEQAKENESGQIEYIDKPYKPFGTGERSKTRIVLFYSNGCQPCQYLKPILESFVVQNKLDLELVSVDEEAGIKHAQEHQIQGWPTLFVVKDNVIKFVTFGADINQSVDATMERLTNEILPFFKQEE